MRTAIVHYWLTSMRGGEKVVKELINLYPDADVYTLFANTKAIDSVIANRLVGQTWLRIPARLGVPKSMLLPLMPAALEAINLAAYDLVISSESGPAKGVITPPHALHVCYCHSPMRYLWDQGASYLDGHLHRLAAGLLSPSLRVWDQATAQRVDAFIANSEFVKRRIWKYYRRDARVLHPPVEMPPAITTTRKEDFYLFLGQDAPYKRLDQAIEATGRLSRRLVVAGELRSVTRRRIARLDHVVAAGRVSDAERWDLLGRARALIFPGVEDFGIVPVEACGVGTPVIAFGRGGVTETIPHEKAGWLYADQSVEALITAIVEFERSGVSWSTTEMAAHAATFSAERFRIQFAAMIADLTSGTGRLP